MPDVSERIRNDPRPAPKPRRHLARAWRAADRRIVAAAALAAMMIGIVVNAVALQHGKRVDLGQVPDPTIVAAVKPVAPAPVAPAAKPAPSPKPALSAKPAPLAPPVSTLVAEAVPEPPRPQPTTTVQPRAPKSGDAIADLLKAQDPGKRKLTRAAQAALMKLGFVVRPSGALDADTRSALLKFEASKKLPHSTEITAKLVRKLQAAADDDE